MFLIFKHSVNIVFVHTVNGRQSAKHSVLLLLHSQELDWIDEVFGMTFSPLLRLRFDFDRQWSRIRLFGKQLVDLLLRHDLFFDIFQSVVFIGFIEFCWRIFPGLISVNCLENVTDIASKSGDIGCSLLVASQMQILLLMHITTIILIIYH